MAIGRARRGTDVKSVAAYIAAQPKSSRATLERVRRIILKALPGCEETISYNIPTYKLNGRAVIYFAGWAAHYSLYPIGKPIVAALTEDSAAFEITKSTIRFPLSRPVPAGLIARIVRMRAQEAGASRVTRRGSSGRSR
jgi:uncharacterized protein YdhG (YjbR/CyaY superfamily)